MILINETYEIDTDIKNPIPVTKTNQDVKKLTVRKGDYSNTITLPNTQQVRTALGFTHDPASAEFSGHTEAIKVKYIENGAELMDGLLKMIESDQFQLKFILISKQLDWKQQLEDKNCNEIELGTFELTRANVIATWVPGTDIVFPVIDWGYFAPFSTNSNWVAFDDPNVFRQLKLYDFYPSFRIVPLITKIFNSIGYTVATSTELDSLYVFATTLIDGTETKNYFQYKLTIADQAISGPDIIIFNTAFTSNPDFDNTTGKYTLPQDLRMRFNSLLKLSRPTATTTANVSCSIYRAESGSTQYESLVTQSYTMQIGELTKTINLNTPFVDLLTDDEIFVSVFAGSAANIEVKTGSSFENQQYLGYAENDDLDLNVFMPDWTQLKLLQELKSLFNLYFDTNNRHVDILLKSEYINDTITDLTDLVDRSKLPYVEYYDSKKFKIGRAHV